MQCNVVAETIVIYAIDSSTHRDSKWDMKNYSPA
jgi:hypothetical protein